MLQWTGKKLAGKINADLLLTGLFSSEVSSDVRTALNFLNMGLNVNNTGADKVVLVARQVAAGTDAGSIWGVINFIEAL